MQKKWTKEEERYLIENYTSQPVKILAASLGRTEASVRRKAGKLGLSSADRVANGKAWTAEDVSYMQENYLGQPVIRTAIKLGRTEESVKKKAEALGLVRTVKTGARKKWTEQEEKYLIKRYTQQPAAITAKKLDRSVMAVRRKAAELGLNHYLDNVGAKAVAKCFNCDTSVVIKWIKEYGLSAQEIRYKHCICYNIDIESFWSWAEKHKDIINWARYEEDSIALEPDWVMKEVRGYKAKNARKRFSECEKDEIKRLLKKGVGCKEIAETMGRSLHSIRHVSRSLTKTSKNSHTSKFVKFK